MKKVMLVLLLLSFLNIYVNERRSPALVVAQPSLSEPARAVSMLQDRY